MTVKTNHILVETDWLGGGDYTARFADRTDLEGHGKTSEDAIEDLKSKADAEEQEQ